MDQSKQTPIRILAFFLWLITTALCILSVYFIYLITLSIYAYFSSDASGMAIIGNVVIILAAIACMVTIITTGEYHYKHAGMRASWKLFAWTITIELLILILRFVI